MYLYYATVTKFRLPRFISIATTLLQVTQMFVGLGIMVVSSCCEATTKNNWHGLLFGGIMYTIYLISFMKILLSYFFVKKTKVI